MQSSGEEYRLFLLEKSVGSCGCGATFFSKKCPGLRRRVGTGAIFLDVLDFLDPVKKGEITRVGWSGVAPSFFKKKKDGEINARARALDTKRLAGITFSFHLPSTMIRFILLQNRQGKTRLAKYYVPLEEDEKHQLETEVHRVVVNRDPKHTSFVEFKNHKLVYRRYAGLFFTLCVDANDNELVHLESIHLFVEILDHFFANVCELDLVFNFQKVYVIVDEFILAGEVQETSKKAILNRLAELEQIKG